MKVGIHANTIDEATPALADALAPVLEQVGSELDGDHGGAIEHLWIDLELLEYFAKADGSPRNQCQV